jgi:DNA repair protein RadC
MSFVVNDSCLESLSAIAAQHEDWIIQQAIVLLERRVFKAGPCSARRRAGLPASETGR